MPPWVLAGLFWIVGAGLAFLALRAIDRASDVRLTAALAVASGCVGAVEFARGVGWFGLLVAWCICTVLDAAVCSEVRVRRVPALLVAPVVVLVAAADVHGAAWGALAMGLAIFACLGLAWARSKGHAAGLGDALLAALAGLALGVELGGMAVATAGFAAAGVALARKQRGAIAFAPYLALTIQVAFLVPVL